MFETPLNPATRQMIKATDKILECFDYGEDGWDEEFVKNLQRQRQKGGNWAELWYKGQIKKNGGFDFNEAGPGYSFATWAAKEALKQVDWTYVGQCIIDAVFRYELTD